MRTYQDLMKVGKRDDDRMAFVRSSITSHQNDRIYKMAVIADQYLKGENTAIMNYRKWLNTLSGGKVEDKWGANYKLPSNFFNTFVRQEYQYLLGNGIMWQDDMAKKKLGMDFDTQVQKAGRFALAHGCAYGLWNYDRLNVFKVTEFVPFYDEENGSLRAGIRFWRLDGKKPLRATLYEEDGYTEYSWDGMCGKMLNEKRQYITRTTKSSADGIESLEWKNYPTFPIVPLWGNPDHQSELVAIKNKLDAYDLIESGFANDFDNAVLYWILHNTGAMGEEDLAKFLASLHTVKAATVDDISGASVETKTVEIPYEAREKILDRLERELYRDYGAFNPKDLASGAVTATQIKAAYEPLNSKVDEFEYCVVEFIQGICKIVGITANPTFTRSKIVNTQEEIQVLLQAAQYLPEDYVTRKLMTFLGDIDLIDDIIAEKDAEDIAKISGLESGD